MELFYEGRLWDVFENQKRNLKADIENQERNYFLNANETDLIKYFTEKYRCGSVEIYFDKVYVSDREEDISIERLDRGIPFTYRRGEGKVRRQVVTYHIPFSGEKDLLRFAPSTRIPWAQKVEVNNDEILLDMINVDNRGGGIKTEADSFLSHIKLEGVCKSDPIGF